MSIRLDREPKSTGANIAATQMSGNEECAHEKSNTESKHINANDKGIQRSKAA
jgi:hypothetical protein